MAYLGYTKDLIMSCLGVSKAGLNWLSEILTAVFQRHSISQQRAIFLASKAGWVALNPRSAALGCQCWLPKS